MHSMLSLFELITCYSSEPLEDIKLIAIVNWIHNVSKFLRWFIMSFKYGLISLGYSWIDKVLFYLYHHYFHLRYNCYDKYYQPCWFGIIFFFFKKMVNVSDYSVFDCFIFLLSQKISYIFYYAAFWIVFLFFISLVSLHLHTHCW